LHPHLGGAGGAVEIDGVRPAVAVGDRRGGRPRHAFRRGLDLVGLAEALASVGVTPGGTVTHASTTFTWPDAAAGQPDNTVASGQAVTINRSGSTLGFLVTSTYGASSGTAPYRNRPNNTQDHTPVNAYYRATTIDPAKVVADVVLPNISAGATAGTPAMHVFAVSVD
jgi:alpha-L-fucosidase 2